VFREVAAGHAYYFSGDDPSDLSHAISDWLGLQKRENLPDSRKISWLTWEQSTDKLKTALIENNYPRHQLLVDISELVQRDAKTGIQRVVRSILKEWLMNPPDGWRVEPVYASIGQPYRYARHFAATLLAISSEYLEDEPIDIAPGDVFFGLDLQPQGQCEKAEYYQFLRRQGVTVKFMVYDLLCIKNPQHFPSGSGEGFTNWVKMVTQSNGAVCISKAVADELSDLMTEKRWDKGSQFSVHWNHLGADIDHSIPTLGLPDDSDLVLQNLKHRTTFLMVGTLEPRKGHQEVLEAFEILWKTNVDVNLVIVGKKGWMVEELSMRLHNHPEQKRRLYWLEGISDEYLEKIYAVSTCLIAASCGEGFGLPLIEAAQHGLPILARDIPVFREVAGEHAAYFKAETPSELAAVMKSWLSDHQKNTHPKSSGMKYLTWKESADVLISKLFSKR
jgi:glycosyltransferase involved in cell wall biosynthesis